MGFAEIWTYLFEIWRITYFERCFVSWESQAIDYFFNYISFLNDIDSNEQYVWTRSWKIL